MKIAGFIVVFMFAFVFSSCTSAPTATPIPTRTADVQAASYGTFSVTKDGSMPLSTVVFANQRVTAAAFKFSAQNDNFTIQEVRFRVASSASNAISSATLMDGVTPIQTKAFTISNASANDTVAFTNLTTTVAANTTKVLTVNVTLADVSGANSAASGAQVLLTNTYLKYTSSTGTLTTTTTPGAVNTNPASNTLVVYKGYPTFTASNESLPNTFVNGTETVLYQWKERANGGNIAIKQLPFRVVFSNVNASTLNINRFRLLKNGVDVTSQVTIRNELGQSIESTTNDVSNASTSPAVYVTWDAMNEDQLDSGQENAYALGVSRLDSKLHLPTELMLSVSS